MNQNTRKLIELIKAVSISRQFNGFIAVEDLNLEIKKGEVFALLGPNGAGKTTTIRILTGLIAPTKGTCTIEGVDVTQNPMLVHRNVGVQPEVPGLYETLSAYRNLEFYGKLFRVEKAELSLRIKDLMSSFDLWDRRDEAVQTFSKGMKQKLSIIRSLLHNPDYVFMDEPMSGLDPVASKTVKDFILNLKREGKTVVLSTHNLDDADRLGDRVAVIQRKLLALDTPNNLRKMLFKRTIVFHLKLADDRIVDELKLIPYVKSAERSENKIVLELEKPEDENPEILEILIRKGYKVQFVGEVRHSLEEVYLKLVNPEEDASAQ
jgi:ABC-2 type transport system ATP-binding protein